MPSIAIGSAFSGIMDRGCPFDICPPSHYHRPIALSPGQMHSEYRGGCSLSNCKCILTCSEVPPIGCLDHPGRQLPTLLGLYVVIR